MRRQAFLAMLGVLAAVSVVRGQSSYPMLMAIKPVAAQAGAATEHTVHARYNLYGAYEVLVGGEGVKGEIVTEFKPDAKTGKKPTLTQIKVRFTVEPGAMPGVRDFRIATPQGVSTLGQLVIGRDPVVAENPKNDTRELAQEIELPATFCGTIEKAEDVDYIKFKVQKGTGLSFHMHAARLQDKIHDLQKHSDPIVTLRNAQGATIAQVDNYFYADPLLHHQFEAAGEYYLEVRDVRYQGNGYWAYSIQINDRPFVTNVHPISVTPGSETPLEPIGYGTPDSAVVKLAGDMVEGPMAVVLPMGDGVSNPAPIVASRLETVVEAAEQSAAERPTDKPPAAEPAAAKPAADGGTPAAAPTPFATAQLVNVPAGINGRIDREGDLDYYRFAAKKGERYSFEVIARRQQSALDPVLRLTNLEGRQLTENDDMRIGKHSYADSLIENWTVPADGEYCIEIRDLHLRGGLSYVYFIKVTRAEPHFLLQADTDKTQLAPSNSGVVFVRVYRKNGFAGEVQLHAENLPAGVTASCGRILAGANDGCIVMTAAPGAAMAAKNIRIWGTAKHPQGEGQPELELAADAQMLQETYMPGGGRGHFPAGVHTVCVHEPLDITKVTLSTHEVALKPGESQKIEIEIERAEGFDKNVTLDLLYRHLNSVYGDSLPAGVTIDDKNSKTLLSGKETKGHITLKADPEKAKPAQRQQAALMANVSINFVMKMTYSSAPLWVTVNAADEKAEKAGTEKDGAKKK